MPTSGGQPGPIYDDAMRLLADDDVAALLTVVGMHATAPLREQTDLAAHTMHPDLLVFVGPERLVHVEYVRGAAPDLGLRMLEYRTRLRRRHRRARIDQHVLVLDDVRIPDRYAEQDPEGGPHEALVTCRWSVTRVGDLEPAVLLRHPTTAALAALGRGSQAERIAALAAAAELISTRAEPRRRRPLLTAADTLASIVLPPPIIETALKEAVMPVPIRELPLAQWLLHEGREEGRRQEAARFTALLLRQRFGEDPRIPHLAERLAAVSDEARVTLLTSARTLDDVEAAARS